MNRIGFAILIVLFLIPGSVPAMVTHLSDSHRKLLEDMSSLPFLKGKAEMPLVVIALCADGDGRLADIGGRWEPTDVISNDGLPRKRLIWAAAKANYFLIHYESGGIVHRFHILLAQTKGSKKADVLWRAVGKKYPDLKAFIKALNNNELEDDPKSAY